MKKYKLGEVLRYYRDRSNLTQQQVSDLIGINRTTYTYYETGKTEPSIDTLHKLIKIFGITYDDLLPSEKNPKSIKDSFLRAKGDEAIYNLTKEEQQFIISLRAMSPEEREEFLKNLK